MVTIEELMYSIGMVELCVKSLKRQIAELASAAEDTDAKTIKCPDCGALLTESNQYNTMGAKYQQYACPNCPFRGEIAGG